MFTYAISFNDVLILYISLCIYYLALLLYFCIYVHSLTKQLGWHYSSNATRLAASSALIGMPPARAAAFLSHLKH